MTAISCPVCQAPFQETVREGILIDTCTQCRGVWLDRGELEKLLSAMRQEAGHVAPPVPPSAPPAASHGYPPPQQPYYPPQAAHYGNAPRRHYDDDDDDDYRRHGRYRKKSRLENLLDIFD